MTRQSDYKPEYDEQVIDWLAEGKTLASFAEYINVSRATLWNWRNEYASFFDSIKKGQAISSTIHAEQFILDAVRDETVQSVPFVMYCRNVLKLKTRDDPPPAPPPPPDQFDYSQAISDDN